jgi:hypothetical protein
MLLLRENPDANVPGCNADGKGENDRSLTLDTKTRSLKPDTNCRIKFRLIQIKKSAYPDHTGALREFANVRKQTP